VLDAYAPNVCVVRRPRRIGGVQPALVDLDRPAFKLGIAEIRVGGEPTSEGRGHARARDVPRA
jgi:hypothetical protein